MLSCVKTKGISRRKFLRQVKDWKTIDFVDNINIIEEHLGGKELHLNKRGNSISARISESIWVIPIERMIFLTMGWNMTNANLSYALSQ